MSIKYDARRLGALAALVAVTACGGRTDEQTSRTSTSGTDEDATDTDTDASEEATDAEEVTEGGDEATDEEPTDVTDEGSEETETAESTDTAAETEVTRTDELGETTDSAVETDATPEETDTTPTPVASSDPLWISIAAPSLSVINVNDSGQRFVGINSLSQEDQQMKPWSRDGRWLANSEADVLTFYDLTTGDLADSVELEGVSRVLGWLGSEFVLVEANGGISMVGLDGGIVEFVPQPEMQGFSGSSASPNGDFFVYTLGGAASYPFYFVDARDKAEPSAPQLLASYDMAPALSFIWSPAGDWLAYGVPSQAGGIYLWNATPGDEPVRFSPEDTSYTPLHSFAPTGESVVSHLWGAAESPVLVHGHLDGGNLGAVTELAEEAGLSPAAWSPAGDYVTYSSEAGGWLHPIDPSNVQLDRTEIPNFSYGCPLRWLDAGSFLYQDCTQDAPSTLYWAEAADAVEPKPRLDAVVSFEVGGSCLVAWDETGFFIGDADASTFEEVLSPIASIASVAVESNGAGFVWSVRDSLMYWQPMVDCTPAGEPILIDAGAAIQQLQFLPR